MGYTLWTYGTLFAPSWSIPLLVICLLPIFAWQGRKSVCHKKRDNPLHLYTDEVSNPGRHVGVIVRALADLERSKKEIKDSVKDSILKELELLKLVEKLNSIASVMEKFHYVIAIGSPEISAACFVILLCVAFLASFCLWTCTRFLGSAGPWYIIWLCGCYILLPRRCRQWVTVGFVLLQRWKRFILRNKDVELLQALLDFWQRLPDAAEERHLELCKHYVLMG